MLKGQPTEIKRTVEAFSSDPGRWVLLCSLKKQAAGTNLQVGGGRWLTGCAAVNHYVLWRRDTRTWRWQSVGA